MICQLIADSRERIPKEAIKNYYRKIKIETMKVGDYRCSCGKFGAERKESDLDNMSQVLRQVEELKSNYEFPFLIVTRSANDFLHSTAAYAPRIAFLASLCARGVTPLFIPNEHDLLELIHFLSDKLHDGKQRGSMEFSPVRHVSKKDKQLNVLTALPGISSTKAELIMKKFKTPYSFFSATRSEMLELKGFGPVGVDAIRKVLGKII